MKRKIISAVLAASMLLTLSSGCASAEGEEIKVIYDGQTLDFDVAPEIIGGRTMVPMRAVFEAFGAKVKWDADTQTITAKRKSKTIGMTIGSSDMTKNDETYSFDISPQIIDGRTLVPVRAISDLLGLDVDWDETDKTVTITTPSDEEDDAWKENVGTINLDTLEVSGSGVDANGNVITITEGGDFEVTGTLADGQIVIDTSDKAKLRLSGMSLTNTDGAAIYIKNADKAYITITENTENVLTDGAAYTSGDDNEKACITSRANLEIKGNGFLAVNGNYNHGIDSSKSVEVGNGNITINAKNDGIHVNNTLAISGGALDITAEGDGIQADEIIDITDGEINITTTGEIAVSSNVNGGMRGFGTEQMTAQTEEAKASEDATSKGVKADWLMDISGGSITVNSTDHSVHCASDINISGGNLTLSSESGKGISAHGDIVIDDGDIDILKATEGIEAKQIMTINGGDIDITASDDGLNAGGNGMDNMRGGDRGQMNADFGEAPSNEQPRGGMRDDIGAEGVLQLPNPGGVGGGRGGERQEGGVMPDMDMRQDMKQGRDNMQPPEDMTLPEEKGERQGEMQPPEMSEGADMPQMNTGGGRGGMGGVSNSSEKSSEHHIQINGGNIKIVAGADGIDSNGSLFIDGGNVTVDAQNGGAESAFDTDGAFLINGGTVIGVSGAGIDGDASSYSEQKIITAYLQTAAEEGSEIVIKNSNGKKLMNYTAVNGGSKIVFSSDEIEDGETYTVTAGGEELTCTVEGTVTIAGTQIGGGRGGMGGRGSMNQ